MSTEETLDRPLRILIAHNAYQQRGGEDAVVEAEAELLRKHGHAVHRYDRHNDELLGPDSPGKLGLLRDLIWSRRTTKEIRELIAKFRPDVIHVHNTLPLISPSIYWEAARANVPVVQTLHNFRLVCPQAQLTRNQKVCTECVGKSTWRAVKYKCYRDSRAASVASYLLIEIHRLIGTWKNKIAKYIILDEFARPIFESSGLPGKTTSCHRARNCQSENR